MSLTADGGANNVKSRVASFEAHNQQHERRRGTLTMSTSTLSPTTANSSVDVGAISPTSSSTRQASQSRIQRLQREAVTIQKLLIVGEDDSDDKNSSIPRLTNPGQRNATSRQGRIDDDDVLISKESLPQQHLAVGDQQRRRLRQESPGPADIQPQKPKATSAVAVTRPVFSLQSSLHASTSRLRRRQLNYVQQREKQQQPPNHIMAKQGDPNSFASTTGGDSNSSLTSGPDKTPSDEGSASTIDPDGPLIPGDRSKGVNGLSPERRSRIEKIHKIQKKNKNGTDQKRHPVHLQDRNNDVTDHRAEFLEEATSASWTRIPQNSSQQRNRQPNPSSTYDDEIATLTSVRRVVHADPMHHGHQTDNKSSTLVQSSTTSSSVPPNRMWSMRDDAYQEEKSDKQHLLHHRSGIVLSRSSSTDYDTDPQAEAEDHQSGTRIEGAGSSISSRRQKMAVTASRSNLSASAGTPDVAAFFEQRQQEKKDSRRERGRKSSSNPQNHRRHQQQQKPTQPSRNRNGDVSQLTKEDNDDCQDGQYYDEDDDEEDKDSHGGTSYEQRRKRRQEQERQVRQRAVAAAKAEMENSHSFIQHEDAEEYYRHAMDTPVVKTAAVVAGAATLGCIVLGPVGLLVGAAAVGIGIGVMQIPEEQRQNMVDKATETLNNTQENVVNSCVHTYRDSGIAEHVPDELDQFCSGPEGQGTETGDTAVTKLGSGSQDESKKKKSVDRGELMGSKTVDAGKPATPSVPNRMRKRGKVACFREGEIVPISQIHSLDPMQQPRAWVDVMASIDTTDYEKLEAMEEILILAKDKQIARILVEEGILDSLMWILGRYFEKTGVVQNGDDWSPLEVTTEEFHAAKVAANCCMTLGKTYCAAVHTEGDLLLMSLYERGTVPEARQLAQMLHEVPHHARVTKTTDSNTVDPRKEVFAPRQMTLPQAEELAAAIKSLAEQK